MNRKQKKQLVVRKATKKIADSRRSVRQRNVASESSPYRRCRNSRFGFDSLR